MRVAGIPLGVGSIAQAYLINVDFSALPLVDLTSRHTISSPAGVTIVTGGANYDGGVSTYSTVSGNDSDFDWSGNFYVVGTFTPTDLTGYRTLWDTHDSAGYEAAQRIGLYTEPDGTLRVYTGGVAVASTLAGAVAENVTSEVGLFRSGTRCYFVVDGVLISDFELTTVFNSANRRMYIGGSAYSSSQFKGIIHSFKTF